jgi:Uma2 family endonuclease
MITLDISPLRMTDEQFLRWCSANRDLRLERTAEGEMVVMPPAGSETGKVNGARLGWFINPIAQRVETYRPAQEVEVETVEKPAALSDKTVLPGFVLHLDDIWE